VERLVFSYGTHGGETPARDNPRAGSRVATPEETAAIQEPEKARRDWAFLGLLLFTAILFLRPQDMITPLRALHLAEVSALFALTALAMGRLGRNLPVTRITPELLAVFAFALVMLATAPFSVWMGGAIGTFTDMYAKVVLIFILMVNTLTTPKRIEQFTWLIVVASGYIAGRAVFDYARGLNLIENGRVQGAVGGMFKNPNDLALNMVSVLPLGVMLVLRPVSKARKAVAALCAALMLCCVVVTQSRSGTIGLAAMIVVLGAFVVRRRPALVGVAVLGGLLALPLAPASYWERVASITNEDLDQTGSREARSILLREAFAAFVANPLTGVGAGQFINYNPEGRQEAWREAHNMILQVAAEVGAFGLMVYVFLLSRAFYAPIQARRLLRQVAPARRRSHEVAAPPVSPADHEALLVHSIAFSAALVGWFVCALFASVAYHWTFYYLLALAAAPRDYLLARQVSARIARRVNSSRTAVIAGAIG
jgi:O-antigen ligase